MDRPRDRPAIRARRRKLRWRISTRQARKLWLRRFGRSARSLKRFVFDVEPDQSAAMVARVAQRFAAGTSTDP